MAFARVSDYDKGVVLGRFNHKETGAVFEYCDRNGAHSDFCPDFPHLICTSNVIGWPYRFARVLGSVAYIVRDEEADGSPVVERWEIKQHKRYK